MRNFCAAARRRYVEANAAALRWMLDRPALRGRFLNTKMNSLTLRDYGADDGLRGPDYLYGWIQGRGLEALATHAGFFAPHAPALAARLDEAGRTLYRRLADLYAQGGDHGYFLYDRDLRPIARGADGALCAQRDAGDLFTYSDAFFVKGLIAGAARYDARSLDHYVARLADVVAAVEDGRFVADERSELARGDPLERRAEFGPWMIVLGAAGLLRRLGRDDDARFGARFVDHVLATHVGGDDLIRDRPGVDVVNCGHAIEFVGFAHEALGEAPDAARRDALRRILHASFAAGFRGPGIVASLRPSDGAALNADCPWWSLPETMRAAALAFAASPDEATLRIWRAADEAFFQNYWRGDPPVAWQTRNAAGPVDIVPATPDLDPGYHTGLSLLAAIEAIDRAHLAA